MSVGWIFLLFDYMERSEFSSSNMRINTFHYALILRGAKLIAVDGIVSTGRFAQENLNGIIGVACLYPSIKVLRLIVNPTIALFLNP